jgi:hypothetical protein
MQSTPATRGESAARRSSIGRCRKSSPLRFKRSNATRQARAEPAFVRKAAKSECPSGRTATASPSIRALSTAKLQIASATFGSLSVKFVP